MVVMLLVTSEAVATARIRLLTTCWLLLGVVVGIVVSSSAGLLHLVAASILLLLSAWVVLLLLISGARLLLDSLHTIGSTHMRISLVMRVRSICGASVLLLLGQIEECLVKFASILFFAVIVLDFSNQLRIHHDGIEDDRFDVLFSLLHDVLVNVVLYQLLFALEISES